MPTALITGPTSGIGNAFARRLADEGWDLVLVARDSARLQRTADQLHGQSGVGVEVLPADLSAEADRARVADRLADRDRPVDLLVNNAGFAAPDGVLGSSYATEDATLSVLVRAVLQLSQAAAQAMAARRRGVIINVSSVAGFLPRGTYGAAKSWVTSFSTSLAAELRPHGVRVVASCPGFTRTEFHARGGFDTDAIPDFLWLSADAVVSDAIDAARRGRVVTVPGRQWKVIVALGRHIPLGTISRATRRLGRQMRSQDNDERTERLL